MRSIHSFLSMVAIAGCLFLIPPAAQSSETARSLQETFAKVAETSFPGVVVIQAKLSEEQLREQLPPQLRPYFDQQREHSPKKALPGAQGSGFIITTDGYIVTNNHVIGKSKDITVKLRDGNEYPAKIVGVDWKTDLAVLKIDAKEDLPVLKFADSNKVKVGHWAIAIGAPFSMDYSMTVGIVSQKGRSVGMAVYEDYIQTDASINPGNSGGPLLNLDGEVIGVNNFIISNQSAFGSAGNIGLGFAIPSKLARKVTQSLIKNGEVVRPWLGISMQGLTPELKKQFKTETGVLVREVFSDNPADKSGIEPGDVLTKVGEISVNTPKQVQFAVLDYTPGDAIAITLIRDGKELILNVKAGKQSSDTLSGSDAPNPHFAKSVFKEFGLVLEQKKDGVYIAEVMQQAGQLGNQLKPGAKISAVNRTKVTTVAEAEAAAKGNGNRLLLYVDNGQSKFFVVLSK